mmetsp:Transcript_96835/g.271071  ORF Transcript_96835/g.271071 Transcript_96835/m.271071 type:complete len:226 (-) Transcript_96835:36-713(-)
MRAFQSWSSLQSTEAPSSNKAFTTSSSPCSAAFMSAVTPSSSFTSTIRLVSEAIAICGSQTVNVPFLFWANCASTRYLTTSHHPCLHAFMSAVSPMSSFALIRAPSSTRSLTTGRDPPFEACINALKPSGSLWSGFAPPFANASRQPSTSPNFAASISGWSASGLVFHWFFFSAVSKVVVMTEPVSCVCVCVCVCVSVCVCCTQVLRSRGRRKGINLRCTYRRTA